MCHDLRDPAATILALIAAARVESVLTSAAEARLEQIAGEATRIADLCREVVSNGQHGPVAMHELAVMTVDSVRLTTGIDATVTAQPVWVSGNASALRRALWNLVDNAARAAGAGGRLAVEVRAEADIVLVVVADSGPGFGAATPGTAGLGMRVAARVVHEHGGSLSVKGSSLLGGAEVGMQLPRLHSFSGGPALAGSGLQ